MVDYEVTDREGESASLLLRGELVGDLPAHHLEQSLERHYVDDGVKVIEVDLSGVEHISLEGIAVLLQLWTASHDRGKRFPIRGAQGQVRERLVETGVLPMLKEG
jgi:anti-anti-sigma regulatory factor